MTPTVFLAVTLPSLRTKLVTVDPLTRLVRCCTQPAFASVDSCPRTCRRTLSIAACCACPSPPLHAAWIASDSSAGQLAEGTKRQRRDIFWGS